MKKLLTTLALAVSLAGAAAAAPPVTQNSDRTVRVAIQNVQFGNPTDACPAGTVAYTLLSLRGVSAGDGTACIQSSTGCDPWQVGCRQVTQAIFTFNLPRGSVTAPLVLRERFLSETMVVQLGLGKISAGTGDYAQVHGSLEGGGIVNFNDTSGNSGLVYFVHTDA